MYTHIHISKHTHTHTYTYIAGRKVRALWQEGLEIMPPAFKHHMLTFEYYYKSVLTIIC